MTGRAAGGMMHVRAPLLLSAALLSGALIPLGGPAAADVGPVPLGLSSSADIVVDEAHGRVFVSGGPSGPGVVVTDLAGTVITTLPHSGATGLALSPDGSRLWLAQPSMGLVSIDTAKLVADKRLPLPTGVCAGDVAVVGDRLVYGCSCNRYLPSGGGYGGIGVLDASTGASYGTVTSGPFYEPRVATGPAGQVYAAVAGPSSTSSTSTTSAGRSPCVGSRLGVCGNLRDLSPSPDGALVITSCGAPYEHTTYSGVHGLEVTHRYATAAYRWPTPGPAAAASSQPARTRPPAPTSAATPPAAPPPPGHATSARRPPSCSPRGLALSSDGSRAWAVTHNSSGTFDLRVLHATSKDATSLKVAADPPSFFLGQSTKVGGWLSWGGTGIAGVTLTVTRTATGANPVALPSVTTRSDGTFTFADSPSTAGDHTYTVSWAGDATRAGVQATTSVTVHVGTSLEVRIDRTASASQVRVGVLLRYSDGSSAAGRTVRLIRQADGVGAALPDVVTDEYGNAAFTDPLPEGTVTYMATVEADGTRPGATATATLASTTLTAQAPATSTVETPLTVSGVLSSPYRAVSGATVSVVRSGCGLDWSASAVTTPNGAWSVSDPKPALGTCTYHASYAGSVGYRSSTAAASTTVELRPTVLTAAAPATAEAGSSVTVGGSLRSGSGAVSGGAVTISRAGCSSTSWSGRTTTAATAPGPWSTPRRRAGPAPTQRPTPPAPRTPAPRDGPRSRCPSARRR